MSAAQDRPLEEIDLLAPQDYAAHGYPWAMWDRLRCEAPVQRMFHAGRPYWAITKHADVTSIGRQPELFLSGPKLLIRESYGSEDFVRPKTLIEQDNPLHRKNRKLISSRFTPRALKEDPRRRRPHRQGRSSTTSSPSEERRRSTSSTRCRRRCRSR